MGDYKKKNGTSFVGDLLRKGKELGLTLAPEILDIASDITGVGALSKLGDLIDKDSSIPKDIGVDILSMAALHLENTKDARAMQTAALSQDDIFSKRFVYYLATFWSITGALYLFLATFTTVVNPKMADTVLGFLLGTIVATIITFFFGSSQGSKDKDKK